VWGPSQVAERIFLDARGNMTRIRYAGRDSDTVAYYPDSRGRDTMIVDALGHVTKNTTTPAPATWRR
jgi:hypothetical protein